jgi:GT2 family glycosyltransferase
VARTGGDPLTARITVVVPTYRRPELLPRLVAALEAQTLGRDAFEVVIVDNASGDGVTPDTLAKLEAASPLRLRVLTIDHNRGPAAARNLGWRSATTPYVAFTDDDCEPVPRWLASGLTQLEFSDAVGVVQGRTVKPDDAGYPYTDWTTYREVLAPSPWFEGCNLFFRRDALEAAGGFDEDFHFGGEDTAAGWSVVTAGWERVYDQDAVVRHDLAERGVGWHALMGWREGNLLAVARKYPRLRTEGFWRPWAFRPHNVVFAAGAAGTVAAALARRPRLLLAWVPWLVLRRPPRGHHRAARLVAERWWVDAATFAGMKAAAVRYRQWVL